MDLKRLQQLAGVAPSLPAVNEAVGDTIAQQMGGAGRLRAMLGAKDIIGLENGLRFRWPNKERSRGNLVRITLRPDDTYDMEFFNGTKPVKKYEGVYADQLVSTFESQTGWYLSLGGSKKAEAAGPEYELFLHDAGHRKYKPELIGSGKGDPDDLANRFAKGQQVKVQKVKEGEYKILDRTPPNNRTLYVRPREVKRESADPVKEATVMLRNGFRSKLAADWKLGD